MWTLISANSGGLLTSFMVSDALHQQRTSLGAPIVSKDPLPPEASVASSEGLRPIGGIGGGRPVGIGGRVGRGVGGGGRGVSNLSSSTASTPYSPSRSSWRTSSSSLSSASTCTPSSELLGCSYSWSDSG